MKERGRPRERPGEPWSPMTVLRTLPHPPPFPSSSPRPTNPIPFFHLLERLKTTPRSGWVQVGIPHGESISDHMYRMAVMAMLPPPALSRRLNVGRCISMALVHDMAECLVGDFTPRDTEVSKGEKGRREEETMDYISRGLLGFMDGESGSESEGGKGSGSEEEEENEDEDEDEGVKGEDERGGGKLMSLFQEYEANETLEAQFVHDVDKLEMLLQVLEYERATGRRLDEFYHVVEEIRLREMQEWAGAVVQEREEFFANLDMQTRVEHENGLGKESGKEKRSWICRWFRRQTRKMGD